MVSQRSRFVVPLVLCIFFSTTFQSALGYNCSEFPEYQDEECCETPVMVNNDISKVCQVEYEKKEKEVGSLVASCYLAECIFKKLGLAKNGKLSTRDSMAYIDKVIEKNSTWNVFFHKSVDMCIAKSVSKEEEIRAHVGKPPYNLNSTACNPLYDYVISCVSVEVIRFCPSEFWHETKNCRRFRNYLDACPDPYLSITNI